MAAHGEPHLYGYMLSPLGQRSRDEEIRWWQTVLQIITSVKEDPWMKGLSDEKATLPIHLLISS